MNIHEYQAKAMLRDFGIEVPVGRLALTPDEAAAAAADIGGTTVVKAQVHAGGRGKAGGIKLAKTPDEARQIADDMIGMKLVTKQTGEEGKIVRRLYVEAASQIDSEMYLAVLVDRDSQQIGVIASTEGGMDIEEVAEKTPDKILQLQIDPLVGICDFQARDLGLDLGLRGKLNASFVDTLKKMYRMFMAQDCSMIEINPLITSGEQVIPLDCKLGFDESALYRHKAVAELHDPDEDDPREAEAGKYDLSWVSLDGNIGCMVNGAGLAMATMDIIQHTGGKPANFLDVGGTADAERCGHAFRLILSDKNVKGILVNIFGGIVQCDLVAEGVITAARNLGVEVPLVVRLDGTNAEKGRQMLAESGLDITPAANMKEAAEKIVAAVQS